MSMFFPLPSFLCPLLNHPLCIHPLLQLTNLMMLHTLLYCCLTMVQALDVGRAWKFWRRQWLTTIMVSCMASAPVPMHVRSIFPRRMLLRPWTLGRPRRFGLSRLPHQRSLGRSRLGWFPRHADRWPRRPRHTRLLSRPRCHAARWPRRPRRPWPRCVARRPRCLWLLSRPRHLARSRRPRRFLGLPCRLRLGQAHRSPVCPHRRSPRSLRHQPSCPRHRRHHHQSPLRLLYLLCSLSDHIHGVAVASFSLNSDMMGLLLGWLPVWLLLVRILPLNRARIRLL